MATSRSDDESKSEKEKINKVIQPKRKVNGEGYPIITLAQRGLPRRRLIRKRFGLKYYGPRNRRNKPWRPIPDRRELPALDLSGVNEISLNFKNFNLNE